MRANTIVEALSSCDDRTLLKVIAAFHREYLIPELSRLIDKYPPHRTRNRAIQSTLGVTIFTGAAVGAYYGQPNAGEDFSTTCAILFVAFVAIDLTALVLLLVFLYKLYSERPNPTAQFDENQIELLGLLNKFFESGKSSVLPVKPGDESKEDDGSRLPVATSDVAEMYARASVPDRPRSIPGIASPAPEVDINFQLRILKDDLKKRLDALDEIIVSGQEPDVALLSKKELGADYIQKQKDLIEQSTRDPKLLGINQWIHQVGGVVRWIERIKQQQVAPVSQVALPPEQAGDQPARSTLGYTPAGSEE